MIKYIPERHDSMIEKISKQITNHLTQKNVIKSETAEMYRYGIELVISTFIGIVLILLCGLVFDMWNCQEMCSRRIPKILDRQESGGVMRDLF